MRRDALYALWRMRRMRRRILRAAARRLYRDPQRDLQRTVLVAGSGRSGTTWLADLLQPELHARILFEPFHSRLVEEYRPFHYFHYLRPDEDHEAMQAYCQRLFSGDIRHPWIDREVEVLRPRMRLVKAIRANLLLGWIRNHFPEVPLVWVVRHPCAVVLSRMELGWDTDRDIAPFLEQPNLVSDFISERMRVIEGARTNEEKHAIVWCVHHAVPLRQLESSAYHLVFYEDLLRRPEFEVPRLFAALGQVPRPSIFERMARPSTTSSRDSAVIVGGDAMARWRNKLSSEQIARVLAVVRAFELDRLYGDELTPRLDARESAGRVGSRTT